MHAGSVGSSSSPRSPKSPHSLSDSSIKSVSHLNAVLKGVNVLCDACISAQTEGRGILDIVEKKDTLERITAAVTNATKEAVEQMRSSSKAVDPTHTKELLNAVRGIVKSISVVLSGSQPLDATIPELKKYRDDVLVTVNRIAHDLQGYKQDAVRIRRKEMEAKAPAQLKEKAALLLNDLKAILAATNANDQEQFIKTTRSTLNRVNSMLNLAKCDSVNLDDEEVTIREATRELITASQAKIRTGSTDDTAITNALNKITETIRTLLTSLNSLSPPSTTPRGRAPSFGTSVNHGTSSVVHGIARDADDEKMVTNRGNVVKELFETENTYRDGLANVIKHFVSPIASLDSPEVVENEALQACLRALPAIKTVTDKIRDEVLTRMARNDPDLGQVFLDIAPELHNYQEYVNRYDDMVQFLEARQHKNKALRRILTTLSERLEQPSYTFGLILPIQRPPRYEMLLREMCKFTNEESESYDNLQKAMKKIKTVNHIINLKKREMDNRKKLSDIAAMLTRSKDVEDLAGVPPNPDGPLSLYSPGRNFVREGALSIVMPHNVRSGNKTVDAYFFLFSDCLLRCKRTGKRSFLWKETIYLSEVMLRDVESTYGGVDHMFVLVPNSIKTEKGEAKKAKKREKLEKVDQRMHNFSCISGAEKRDWMADIEENIGLNDLFDKVGRSRINTIRGAASERIVPTISAPAMTFTSSASSSSGGSKNRRIKRGSIGRKAGKSRSKSPRG